MYRFVLPGLLVVLAWLASPAWAGDVPRIAVTDLAYEEQVSSYFRMVNSRGKSSERGSRDSFQARQEESYQEVEGTYAYVEAGELRKFTSDIKGALLKLGGLKLVPAKPFQGKDRVKLFDIVERIKKGAFAGADYVLFGTVSSIEFRNEVNPVPGASSSSVALSLELVAEFNLVNASTHEITAAFTAMGEGQDTRLVSSRGGRVVPSRGRVVADVSLSLAEDVASQVDAQLGLSQAE